MNSVSSSPQQPRQGESAEDYVTRQHATIPPVVYLPTVSAGGAMHEVEMRTTNDGRVALLAYTALDRLADCCGAGQSWILAHTSQLGDLGRSQPFDVIYLDMALPPELRKALPSEPEEPSVPVSLVPPTLSAGTDERGHR